MILGYIRNIFFGGGVKIPCAAKKMIGAIFGLHQARQRLNGCNQQLIIGRLKFKQRLFIECQLHIKVYPVLFDLNRA